MVVVLVFGREVTAAALETAMVVSIETDVWVVSLDGSGLEIDGVTPLASTEIVEALDAGIAAFDD